MFRMLHLALGASLLFLSSARAEGPAPAPRTDAAAATVTVFAAASLKNSLDEIAALWKTKTGGEMKLSYAASMTLAKQIESGAPADMFFSADRDSMDYLAARELLAPKSRTDLLGNALVVVAPRDSAQKQLALTKSALEQAIGAGRVAMGEPNSVPAGKYAKEAFTALGLWAVVEPHAAYAENVRGALMFVAREESPLGVVYATDAAAEPKVKIVATFPESSHPPIVYPLALTRAASGGTPVKLLEFLRSEEAARIFKKYGFVLLARPQ
jgi:molybdate transport system substrate-binding protein